MKKFLLFFGLCLIIIGIYAFRQSSQISQITPNTLNSPIPQTSFAKVTRVIDGDTIEIEGGKRVRYIGMNTPEIETSECYATEAAKVNSDLVLGKEVKLEKDISETDEYGRLLRYVYLGNVLINDKLINDGLARIMTVSPDIKYRELFKQSEEYAIKNGSGVWSACPKLP